MDNRKPLSQELRTLHGENSERNVVLCIEDERVQRKAIGGIAEKLLPGFRVETVKNKEGALAKISEELRGKVALVFISSSMEGGDIGFGFVALLRVYAEKRTKCDMNHVPIVMNSFDGDYADTETAKSGAMKLFIEGGMIDSFVQKPLGAENVQQGIASAIDRVRDRIAMGS